MKEGRQSGGGGSGGGGSGGGGGGGGGCAGHEHTQAGRQAGRKARRQATIRIQAGRLNRDKTGDRSETEQQQQSAC